MPYSEETASYKVSLSYRLSDVQVTALNLLLLQFNHTMLRIKDPKISLPFYTDASLYRRLSCPICQLTAPIDNWDGSHRQSVHTILRFIWVSDLMAVTAQGSNLVTSHYISSPLTTRAARPRMQRRKQTVAIAKVRNFPQPTVTRLTARFFVCGAFQASSN